MLPQGRRPAPGLPLSRKGDGLRVCDVALWAFVSGRPAPNHCSTHFLRRTLARGVGSQRIQWNIGRRIPTLSPQRAQGRMTSSH